MPGVSQGDKRKDQGGWFHWSGQKRNPLLDQIAKVVAVSGRVKLSRLADALAALPDWTHDACDHALRALAESAGVKAGLLINATRVAIVGQAVAPPLFDTMVVLGKERVVGRLRRALSAFGAK